VVEDAVSLLLSRKASLQATLKVYSAIRVQRGTLRASLPEPPEADVFEIVSQDLLATWAFGADTNSEIGWRARDTQTLSASLVSLSIVDLLDEVMRVLEYYGVGVQTRFDVSSWRMRNEESQMLQVWLPAAVKFVAAFEGSRGSDALRQLNDCHQALQALCSTDERLPEFSAGQLLTGIAASRGRPRFAVQRVVGRLAEISGKRLAEEGAAVQELIDELDEGWTVYPVPCGGRMWDSVAPRWVFVGPPSSIFGGINLLSFFDDRPWLKDRCIVEFRRLDGSFHSAVKYAVDDWFSMSEIEDLIVQEQLAVASTRFQETSDRAEISWPPLAQFLLLSDVLSREKRASAISGQYIQPPFDLGELMDLAAEAPEQTGLIIDQLRRELGDANGGKTIAERLSEATSVGADPLVDRILECQKLLASQMRIRFEEPRTEHQS
jgi:hypothetical protein